MTLRITECNVLTKCMSDKDQTPPITYTRILLHSWRLSIGHYAFQNLVHQQQLFFKIPMRFMRSNNFLTLQHLCSYYARNIHNFQNVSSNFKSQLAQSLCRLHLLLSVHPGTHSTIKHSL